MGELVKQGVSNACTRNEVWGIVKMKVSHKVRWVVGIKKERELSAVLNESSYCIGSAGLEFHMWYLEEFIRQGISLTSPDKRSL